MAKQKHLKFSKEEFDIKTCVQKFGKKLPALIVIREGEEAYLVGDDETEGYCFHTGEVYWLTHIIKIERVIAQDSKREMLSIPVQYPVNFCYADSDGTPSGDSQPLKWMTDGRMDKDELFIAENDKGGMGLLAYKGSYKERFFISNPVYDDLKPNKDPVVIPFHSEITASEVTGFENGTAREFDKYLDDLVKITNKFENALNTQVYAEVEKFSGITDNFEGVDYDYVKPSNYVTWGEIKRTREFEHDDAFPSDKSCLPPVDPKNVPKPPERFIERKKYRPIKDQRPPAPPPGEKGVMISGLLSPSKDEDFQHVSTYNPVDEASNKPKLKESHQQYTGSHEDDGEQLYDNPDELEDAPPPPLPPSRGQKLRPRDVPQPPKLTLKEKIKCVVLPQQQAKPVPKSFTKTTNTTSSAVITKPRKISESEPHTVDSTTNNSKSTNVEIKQSYSCRKQFQEEENPYKSMKDLPPQLSQLTVENVGNCLKLLHLHKYVDIFRDKDIDGMLLETCLDDKILTEELGMSRLDVKKLTLFLEKRWHPT